MIVKRIEKEQWLALSKDAHEVVFKTEWEPNAERPDFALIATTDDNQLIMYVTVRELDPTSCYMLYGGSFPTHRGSLSVFRGFREFVNFLFKTYRTVQFHTENKNFSMLKFAIAEQFLASGCTLNSGKFLIEFRKER